MACPTLQVEQWFPYKRHTLTARIHTHKYLHFPMTAGVFAGRIGDTNTKCKQEEDEHLFAVVNKWHNMPNHSAWHYGKKEHKYPPSHNITTSIPSLWLSQSVGRGKLKVCKFFGTLLRWGDSKWLFIVIIKVAVITRSFAFWNKWCFDLKHKEIYHLKTKYTWLLIVSTLHFHTSTCSYILHTIN